MPVPTKEYRNREDTCISKEEILLILDGFLKGMEKIALICTDDAFRNILYVHVIRPLTTIIENNEKVKNDIIFIEDNDWT